MKHAVVLFFLASLFALPACKDIREDTLIKGLWQVNSYKIDSSDFNAMDTLLQHYGNGNDCCRYKVDFQDDNVVFGYYLTYDTFNYVSIGTWELLEYNKLYLHLDNYFDGEFDLKKDGTSGFLLTSLANHIKAFDMVHPDNDTAYVQMELRRL